MQDMMIGVDLAKNVFQVHGALWTGGAKFRKTFTRNLFPACLPSLSYVWSFSKPAVVPTIGRERWKRLATR